MAKTKAKTPVTSGRIGRATLEKIHEVQLGLNEELATVRLTLGNLIQEKEKLTELTEEMNQIKGGLEILANQVITINQGTANALQVMDAHLTQMRQQQASYQSMSQGISPGMASPYQNQGQEGQAHQ
jgi:hypothetical protein